jgi:Na+/H+ antiporter NhaD/arsenite permease-like protein
MPFRYSPTMSSPESDHHSSIGAQAATWAEFFVAFSILGGLLGLLLPGAYRGEGVSLTPDVPLILVAPFALLLACVALAPFVNARWWHTHYPSVALALGGLIAGYYLAAFRQESSHHLPWGLYAVKHSLLEYYSFLALVGGLYIASGSIVVELRGRGRPALNTALLLFGAIAANLVGTTGASVLLIRPFMRINYGRLRPIHIVFFIFIVSNCGGCLTPIGDPPLYLGFLKGVPFFWTLEHLWKSWLIINGLLLAIFYFVDRRIERTSDLTDVQDHPFHLRVKGTGGLIALALMIAAVFIDPVLLPKLGLEGWPVGATVQLLIALAAYLTAPKFAHEANEFNFAPIKEVGLLFAGIFLTMIPALGYLSIHGPSLGLDSPTAFYFGTGLLSAVLDNAPTYLNFLQIAFGPGEMDPASIHAFLATPHASTLVEAISGGAVFFGAMTYIGNGPNFMVRAIAEHRGVKMPSFFAYAGMACAFLLPVLVVHWAIRYL